MSTLFIDFETRSTVDIKKAGADVYARHPSTEVLCVGFAVDDHPVQLWTPESSRLHAFMVVAHDITVAHNASFELAIWNNVCVEKYGWQPLKPEQVHCTMAMSYAMALPGALADAAPAAGLNIQKDSAGHRVMMQLSKPREISPCSICEGVGRFHDGACSYCEGTGKTVAWWTPSDVPEKFEKLYSYCKQDIEVERQLYKRLVKLSPQEQKLWILDRKINDRGIQIDIKAAQKAIELVELEAKRLNEEMRKVTDGYVYSCTAVGQLTDWLKSKGVECDGVSKSVVSDLLSGTLDLDVRRALELRQEAAKSSTKKLVAMLSGACEDGRVRGLFQYHGAGATGRFAGRRIQPQNFPRPKLKQPMIEDVFGILRSVK